MRIWDIHPGYLNRQSLLGEHNELHGIVSILVHREKGFSRHPEILRWAGYGWALRQRHRSLAAEMTLRGFHEKTPVTTRTRPGFWPERYLDEPCGQFQILEAKYRTRMPGRIPLPRNAQQLWSQHKYSVMARDFNFYKQLGRTVCGMTSPDKFCELAKLLTEVLRTPPRAGELRNALQHMWGYVSAACTVSKRTLEFWSPGRLLEEIQRLSLTIQEPYLTRSTALSELKAWIPIRRDPVIGRDSGAGVKEADLI